MVEEPYCFVDISLQFLPERCSFWKESTQEAVRVFACAPFPRMVRVREVHFRAGVSLDEFPEREFAPAIIRNGATWQPLQRRCHGLMREVRTHLWHDPRHDEPALAVHVHKQPGSVSADDGVALPIPDARAVLHHLGPRFNAPDQFRPSLDLTRVLPVPVSHLAPLGQKDGKVFPRALNPGVYGVIRNCSDLSRRLLGGATSSEKLHDSITELVVILNFPLLPFRPLSQSLGLSLGNKDVVFSRHSFQFPGDGTSVDAEYACAL